MIAKEDILHDDVLRAFRYDYDTGHLVWRAPPISNKNLAGRRAGKIKLGYVRIDFGGRSYSGHHLAWFYATGEWPAKEIDHINRRRADNRIDNLRLASKAQNAWNQGLRKSRSGLRGAAWNANLGKYQAVCKANGKAHYLGVFETAEEAHAAYLEASRKFHGEYGWAG